MKLKTIFMSALAIAMLTNCNDDDGGYNGNGVIDADVAYLSIQIETQKRTRSSGENPGENESDIKSLYLVTFDKDGKVTGIPGTGNYFIEITPPATSPEAVKISAASTGLLVVVNPGELLRARIGDIGAGSYFSAVNAAINETAEDEVTDDTEDITKGFAMINSGSEEGLGAGDKMTSLLIDITDKMIKPEEGETEDDAKDKAEDEDNRVEVKIERFASKLELAVKTNLDVKPSGSTFKFGNWTLDVVNTSFFPCAEKTILEVDHSAPDPFYDNNFYTHDPNFTGTVGEGLAFAKIDPDNFAPIPLEPYGWQEPSITGTPAIVYCLENTMDAPEQKFGNATRIVVKGTYYPKEHVTKAGDWFFFAGEIYQDLAGLKAAYTKFGAESNLGKACDKMYASIKAYSDRKGLDPGANFMALDEEFLKDLPNGGEMIKDKKEDVIRWYQNGLNYYYYEVRHDNETVKEMDFGKYGVVRNNWYSLTLGSVDGAGTPWYPDPNNPGPGDPDPEDPIDESAGYLGITVMTAPWIIWENEIGI